MPWMEPSRYVARETLAEHYGGTFFIATIPLYIITASLIFLYEIDDNYSHISL